MCYEPTIDLIANIFCYILFQDIRLSLINTQHLKVEPLYVESKLA